MELTLTLFCVTLLSLTDYVSGIRISEKKCNEYRTTILQPTIQTYTETDEDAAPKEFPFMAIIHDASGYYYNGILISENFVLSVASSSYQLSGNVTVVLGDLDRLTTDDDARPRTYQVITTYEHPDFNYDDQRSDVKLYKLDRSVEFDEYIRPGCLSQSKTFDLQRLLLQIGWSETNIRSNTLLHKVKLNYVDDKTCKRIYESAGGSKYIKDIGKGKIFCAGPKKGDREMGASLFGSALVKTDSKMFDEIVGIASLGFNCNTSSPIIFVRVSEYTDWIESIVWSSEYQKPFQWSYILMFIVAIALMIVIAVTIYFKICASKTSK